MAQSTGLLATLEVRRCRVAGFLPGLETDMLGWEAGQHQPDPVAAATIVFDTLAASAAAAGDHRAPMTGRLGQRYGGPAFAGHRRRDGATVHPLNP